MKYSNCIYKISPSARLKISSMELPQSGCVTIVGSNGSGKSSLARALEGTLELIEGERTGSLQAEDSARISFEQQLKLIEEDVVRSLCSRLKIEQLLDRPYSILSSGEGRKVLIARAVLSNKSMIIMDAPFDGLDVGFHVPCNRKVSG